MKKIFLLIGPSGSGKDTLGSLFKDAGIPELVSTTTRKMRKGEVDGISYNFINKEEFNKIDKIEESEYAGNFYCLSSEEVNSKLKDYDSVFAIVDIEGSKQIKEKYPKETITIFIEVTIEEMIARMRARGDKTSDIADRVRNAILNDELNNGEFCDYVIRNKELDMAEKYLKEIILLEKSVA